VRRSSTSRRECVPAKPPAARKSSGAVPEEESKNGLPAVAFSAGVVVCGPNVLTSNDLNPVPTMHFDGLG